MQPAIYQTVPQRLPPVLFTEGQADLRKTADFLRFPSSEFARLIGTPRKAVRLDARTAEVIRVRLTEIATICALVMDFFGGDLDKTCLWFTTRNPLLGNISPREMIRLGLYRRVLRFVQEARAQEPPLAA